ncbi:MAG TPA: gamma-glutamylcyclotransferase family protein [Desulfomonilaceae bacterium]|nr:gamma-glutamylcyclotransferase family protein [Desulfomonilaceae bacterium]
MAHDFVFAYGSNMNRSDLRAWLEADGFDSSLIIEATPATLDGYDFVWNFYSTSRGGGAANLEPKEKSTIWGMLIEFDEALLKAFDRKEGHPFFYSRGDERISVRRADNGKTVFAWLYIARPNKGNRRDIWPSRDYKKIVLNAATFWGFPEDYIEKIKAWPTQ